MSRYPDQANHDLLERIPLTAGSVLDVGCGTGALGAAYRPFNPRARWLGIDNDPSATRLAAQRLDQVATVDVEQIPLPFVLDRPVDCIVYGNVLEHLRDPWAVIRRHAEALSEDGMMLISVPNMQHWSFADRLLRGTSQHATAGLLDARYLCWFSVESMRDGLLSMGLVPQDVTPRIVDAEEAQQFAAALAPALLALGVEPAAYVQRAAPSQHIWRVLKRPRQMMSLAANMLAPVGGVSHVRIIYPLQALRRDPALMVQLPGAAAIRLPGADMPRIFILHRPALSGERGRAALHKLLADGWVIVTEFDDHPDHFGMLDDDDQLAFRGVHAVQVSTPALAKILRDLNPTVAVFPNAVRALPEVRNFADARTMTLFFGALNRERDWAPLMPVLNEVAEKAGDRLRFCVVHDRAFFDALHTPHRRFTPTCDHDTYLDLLGQCEICLMPLADTPFNRAKSDLKFIEAGAARVAAVASRVMYCDSIEDGRTGLLFGDAEELRDRLLRLVAMPELARKLGDAARGYVRQERMLAYQVAHRIAWYRSLWARRAELTETLHRRLGDRLQTTERPAPMPADGSAGTGDG